MSLDGGGIKRKDSGLFLHFDRLNLLGQVEGLKVSKRA
jgi:hypothetical protein